MVKKLPANEGDTGDLGSISGLGRSPGERNDNPLQYSCLENPMDGGAWQTAVNGVAKSQTRLSNFTHSLTHSLTHFIAEQRNLAGYSPWGHKDSVTIEHAILPPPSPAVNFPVIEPS